VETGNHLGGRWSTTVDTLPVVNPANGDTLATVPRSGRETANAAVAAAKAAANAWATTPVFERAAMCMAIAAGIDAAREALAHTLSCEQGKVLA
ncbi:aldehyde dehydrogenase, partial [Pseudomonas sp. FW300-N1A1]|uniref:aldehyde dehydrogenase family protein n=1 Tax=Pseudomonas sp. FW300-N1A1 TaxID=2075555 RepID=UPI000CD38AC7